MTEGSPYIHFIPMMVALNYTENSVTNYLKKQGWTGAELKNAVFNIERAMLMMREEKVEEYILKTLRNEAEAKKTDILALPKKVADMFNGTIQNREVKDGEIT